MIRSRRVPLPAGVRPPFEVYLNGVRQELGRDYEIAGGALVFPREIVRQSLGLRAWLLGTVGIGTYRQNDEVDVRYTAGGRTLVAHALAPAPPDGGASGAGRSVG